MIYRFTSAVFDHEYLDLGIVSTLTVKQTDEDRMQGFKLVAVKTAHTFYLKYVTVVIYFWVYSLHRTDSVLGIFHLHVLLIRMRRLIGLCRRLVYVLHLSVPSMSSSEIQSLIGLKPDS